MRAYNRELDNYYSPDDTPHLYLENIQIEEALNNIQNYESQDEKDVRTYIMKIEKLNANQKKGKITEEDCLKSINELAEDFANKYDYWPYMTKTFKEFYNFFID